MESMAAVGQVFFLSQSNWISNNEGADTVVIVQLREILGNGLNDSDSSNFLIGSVDGGNPQGPQHANVLRVRILYRTA